MVFFYANRPGSKRRQMRRVNPSNTRETRPAEDVYKRQRQQMQLWKSIPLTGAKKVFVMFGLNDVALYGVDKTIENFGTLFGKIREAVPDVQFYVLSATYVKAGGERGKLNSANLRALNVALIDFCAQNGYEFINIADALADACLLYTSSGHS